MRTVAHESSVKSSIRYGLVLLGAAAAVGCGGDSIPITSLGEGPPPEPSYSLTLTGSALSSPQGSATPPMTVSLGRIAFTGNVALSVESLPTGVDAYFFPDSSLSGSSTRLWLSVGREAPIGTFNLLVRGVAPGLLDRVASFRLTITEAPFVASFGLLTLSSSTLSFVQGSTATPTTTVSLVRDNYAGPVTLWADIGNFHGTMPPGVTAAFKPNPMTDTISVLTFSVSGAAVPGVYDLWINAEATPGRYLEGPKLTLTITAARSP